MPRPQTVGCTAALSVLLVIIRNKKGLPPLRYSVFALRAQPGSGSEEAPGGAAFSWRTTGRPTPRRHNRQGASRRQPSHSGPHTDAGATSNQASAHPHTDDHRPRPQRRSPRTAARPRGRQTPASRTQTRIRPESAQNRQNPHCPRRRRSKNATGSVLSDFSRGSGVYNLAIHSGWQATPSQRGRGIRYSRQVKTPAEAYAGPGSKPRPSEEEPPETDPCRHHRTASSATTPTPRRHAPRTPGGPSRLDSSHAPGRHISPPCRRRPDHRSARTPPGASRLVPHTLGAALPVLCAARRLAVEERTNRRANAATRSRSISGAPRKKKAEAPHTRQRPPPRCREMR